MLKTRKHFELDEHVLWIVLVSLTFFRKTISVFYCLYFIVFYYHDHPIKESFLGAPDSHGVAHWSEN